MLKITIKTAPERISSPHRTNDRAFGNPSSVRLILTGVKGANGIDKTSAAISVSGQDGSVQYDSLDSGVTTIVKDGKVVPAKHPFAADAEATFEVDAGQVFGLLTSVEVRLESSSFSWYPEWVRIEDTELAVSYDGEFEKNNFLTPAANETIVELFSDVTVPDSDGVGADRMREDLASQLLSIQPTNAVKITFNRAVNRSADFFKPGRMNGRAQSLSIRYMDDLDGLGLTPEISAGGPDDPTFSDWTDVRSSTNLESGTYYWEYGDKSIVIAPPIGGWPYGRYVRFEFDRSLSDGSGNKFKDDLDQVIYMMVSPELNIQITSPRKEVTYLPWESGDREEGDPNDFYVTVSGTVSQAGAQDGEFVKEIHLTATNENEDTSIGYQIDNYRIPCGETARDTLLDGSGGVELSDGKEKGFRWEPGKDANSIGFWTINLPLQHPEYAGTGAQAVAESRYKWKIQATAITQNDVGKTADEIKIVYHEIFKPRVTKVSIAPAPEGLPGGEVYRHAEGQEPVETPLKLTARDVGPKTFTVELRGDFPDGKSFSYSNTYDVTLSNLFLSTDIEQSDDARQGEEEADTTLAPFTVDNNSDVVTTDGRPKNNTQHTLTFAAKTKANSRILFHLNYEVDTVPLDVVKAEAVPFDSDRLL